VFDFNEAKNLDQETVGESGFLYTPLPYFSKPQQQALLLIHRLTQLSLEPTPSHSSASAIANKMLNIHILHARCTLIERESTTQ
jgi:hypothetical protein